MSEASSKSQEQGDLLNLAEDMKASLNIRDRKHHFRTYRQCFVGEEAVSWMLQRKIAIDAEHAVRIGNDMMKLGLFHHVKFEHAFRNKGYFYRFHDFGHESESEDDEPPIASPNHPANSIHAKPSVRQRYALAAEVTRINRHLSALRSDLEAQSSTHGTIGDTAVEHVKDTQAQVHQLEDRLKQMEKWQVRLAEQNAFHWSVISLMGGATCLLACLWCLQTLSATSAALLILLIGTAAWLLYVQAGRLQKGHQKQQQALAPVKTSSALRRTRSSLVPPSPTYETPEDSISSGSSSGSSDEEQHHHQRPAKGRSQGLMRPSHSSGRPDSEVLAEPPTMEDFEECPHAPILLRARQLPYQHFPSCNPCCIPINSTSPVDVETDQFKGRLSIWIQGLDTSPPDLFQGKRRKTAIVIQGTFKEPLLYEDVLTGQEFGRTPTNLPARWLVDSVLLKLAKRISPSMEIGPLSKPYLMVPSVAMAQCIQVSHPGSEPDISQPSMDPQEDMRLAVPFLSSSGKPWASSKRKGWMSDKRNLQGRRFDTQHVWTFHLYQHFVDMAKYELDMVYRFDLTRNLDGQPLQFMFKDNSSSRYLFNVEAWHTGLLPAARKYIKQHSHSEQENVHVPPQPDQPQPAGQSHRNISDAGGPQSEMRRLSGQPVNVSSAFSQPSNMQRISGRSL
ncbi:hypothetical protein WJX74_003723 [Apatococcus lobatus]|uniref:DEP domain-containing protein n=1 Tax=Apatococcus lobatus TaxID=904363 RepID=A0AAW1RMN8_9CHLO